MLINLSNHPSTKWSPQQIAAIPVKGSIIDLPFPDVDPFAGEEYIQELCEKYLQKIDALGKENSATVAVHIMGEMTFTCAMINALQKRGITCMASTTERVSSEVNGVKTSEFKFVRFRRYLKTTSDHLMVTGRPNVSSKPSGHIA